MADRIEQAFADIRAAIAAANAERDRFGTIAATIRVNAMRLGASDAEIDAMVRGEASFVNFMVEKLDLKSVEARLPHLPWHGRRRDGMSDMTTEYRGVTLHFVKDTFGDRKGDLWEAWGDTDVRGTLSECMAQIDRLELEKRVASGMKLWSLEQDNPKYWGQYDALFRDGNSIMFRNGSDPDRTYSRPRADCALVTPEVEAAIEAARKAHAVAVEAGREWQRLRRAIPRLSAEDALTLPERIKT